MALLPFLPPSSLSIYFPHSSQIPFPSSLPSFFSLFFPFSQILCASLLSYFLSVFHPSPIPIPSFLLSFLFTDFFIHSMCTFPFLPSFSRVFLSIFPFLPNSSPLPFSHIFLFIS